METPAGARSMAHSSIRLSPVAIPVAAFVALAFLAMPAHADEAAAHELLARMATSLRSANYEGSFIYQHDGRTDALRIFHSGGTPERERLISLTGARGEVVRDGTATVVVQTGGMPTLFASRAESQLLPLVPNVDGLGEEYAVATAGDERVAGYDARIVEISPRDPYRYGYRLWLSKDNQLLLRSAVFDAAKRPLEQFMFVALDVGTRPSETDLVPSDDVAGAAAPSGEMPLATRPAWNIVDVPPGFRLVRAQQATGAAPESEHLVYSDGVASVSVYIEPHPLSSPVAVESGMKRGVLSVHSLDAAGVRVTALGDVPPATVQAMARGVRSATARTD
ncbi:MAG TPA: MucB/RseB C-terminal domain-containing protein [Rhodanobacteraceae bacterium]|nr:MucB/RseB C-terminal domain-containing protein [Rhodanobacteraceae bacterium]